MKLNGCRFYKKSFYHNFIFIVATTLVLISGCSQGTINNDDDFDTKTVNSSDSSVMREWSSLLNFPSDQEIAEFNETADSRSPYLTGWLDIKPEVKFTEYSIDFKADYLPYGTYLNCANMKMDLSSLEQEYEEVYMDSWLSCYAGFQMRKPEEGSSSIMSFWDIYCKDKEGETTKIRAKLVYPENDTENPFDNEGNGVNYIKDSTWEAGRWYRMLLKCSESEENGHMLVEQSMCNLETGEWTKICCYDVGITDSCFVGSTAIFLENYLTEYAGDIRTAEYKNIQIRLKDTEQWVPISRLTISADRGQGSYCYGADDEQFWMITTGVENCFIQQPEEKKEYQVISDQNDPPY